MLEGNGTKEEQELQPAATSSSYIKKKYKGPSTNCSVRNGCSQVTRSPKASTVGVGLGEHQSPEHYSRSRGEMATATKKG